MKKSIVMMASVLTLLATSSVFANGNYTLELNKYITEPYHSVQVTFLVDDNKGVTHQLNTSTKYNNIVVSDNGELDKVTTLIDNGDKDIDDLSISYDLPFEEIKSDISVKYLSTVDGKINKKEITIPVNNKPPTKPPTKPPINPPTKPPSKETTEDTTESTTQESSTQPLIKIQEVSTEATTQETTTNIQKIPEQEKPVPMPVPISYNPLVDIESHWAKEPITNLVNRGIISGYPDGTFKPDNKIKRADLFVMVDRMLSSYGLSASEINNSFIDIPNDTYYTQAIVNLSSLGVINGYPDDTIKPDNNITREEVCVILSRVLDEFDVKLITTRDIPFSDTNEFSEWSSGAIFSLTRNVINGYPDETFKPKNNITRAEVSQVLIQTTNIIDKYKEMI